MEARLELARSGLRIMWCVTLALAASAPILRAVTGVRGIERWPVYTCAVLMLVMVFTTRRLANSSFTAILMSASAIGFGAALGFLTLAIVSGKTVLYLLALKWLLGGAFLQWLYLKQLPRLGEVEPEVSEEEEQRLFDERIAGKTPEQIRAMFEEEMAEGERLFARLHRHMNLTWVLILLAVALLIASFFVLR